MKNGLRTLPQKRTATKYLAKLFETFDIGNSETPCGHWHRTEGAALGCARAKWDFQPLCPHTKSAVIGVVDNVSMGTKGRYYAVVNADGKYWDDNGCNTPKDNRNDN